MSNDILNAVQEYMINGHVSDAPFIINDYVITLERLDNGVRISATRGGQTESVVVYDGDLTNLNHEVLANRNANDQHPINAISGLRSELDSKQGVISDLEQIRTNAGKGATAVQRNELSDVAMTGSYNDLNGKPNLARVATSGSYNDLVDKPSMVLDHNNLTGRSGYNQHPMSSITGLIDNLNGKQGVIADLSEIRANARKADTAVQPSDLARVATTGSYNDLTDKPTVFGNEVEVGPTPEDADLWIDTSESGSNVDPSVRWDVEQNLTDAQKERARNNIGAASGGVSDVQINGASVVTDGVATIPTAKGTGNYGVIKIDTNGSGGLFVADGNGLVRVNTATNANIDSRNTANRSPINPANLDYAVKAAMCDGRGAAWTATEQAAARERMGAAHDEKFELIETIDLSSLTHVFSRSIEPNGAPYNYTAVMIITRVPSKPSSIANIYTTTNLTTGSNHMYNTPFTANNQELVTILYIKHGLLFGLSYGTASNTTVSQNVYFKPIEVVDDVIKTIAFSQNGTGTFPEGTTKQIYAIRA